jgi:protein-tyrosine kinase
VGLIDRAARRLAQLERAGVPVNWTLAGLSGPGEAPIARAPERAQPIAAAQAAPVLASVSIDLALLESSGHATPGGASTPMGDAFRRLKRPLLDNARSAPEGRGRRPWHVAIASALPGEGKTFCAISLALSLSMEVDTSVVLIDADVARSSLFGRLGITASAPGLLDLLADESIPVEQAVLATQIPGLKVLGPGSPQPGAAERLASDAMDRVLDRLDVLLPGHLLVFDLPPLLPTTEAAALANRAGQVVLVVQALRTPRPALAQALEMLSTHPQVLTLLNRDPEAAHPSGYGYGYGSHASSSPPDRRRP